jgi:hypothetical protein
MSAAPDARRDLELLAGWLPVLEGRALDLRPRRDGGAGRLEGRDDRIDARTASLRAALAALARLEAVAAAYATASHTLVLAYAYLVTGPAERAQWDGRYGGFDARLAMVLTTTSQRRAWLLNPAHSMATEAARSTGAALRTAAEAAYADCTPDGRGPRLALATVRAQVTTLVSAADTEIATLNRVRQQNRVRGWGR